MYAYSGILTALLARASHGRGAVVDVSLFDALAEWMSAPAAYTAYGGIGAAAHGPASRVDRAVRTGRDARWRGRSTWRFRMRASGRGSAPTSCGQPELATDARFATNPLRVANRAALDAAIAARRRRADRRRVHRAARRGADRLRAHELDGGLRRASAADGARPLARRRLAGRTGPRARAAGARSTTTRRAWARCRRSAQHTDAILRELGFGAGAIAAWRAGGTI